LASETVIRCYNVYCKGNALGHGKTYEHAVTAKKGKFPITKVRNRVYLKN